MENPYRPPQAHIDLPQGTTAPLTWIQILFSFTGRIPRRQFWGALGLQFLAGFVFGLLILIPLGVFAPSEGEGMGAIAGLVVVVLNVFSFWSAFAVFAKRWHDMDKSGWMVLLFFVPLANLIAFIICGVVRGTVGQNRFGGDPT